MSSSITFEFTRENIDTYIKEVAKDFRKRTGKKVKAELILIGGASVLLNYDFRQMTTDIDAMYEVSSAMKESINYVGDKYGLPLEWLNTHFKNTTSYTPKLRQYAMHYKTFANVVSVYTVKAEYLVAMKLVSGRKYKNDLSDIVGVLAEHKLSGKPLTLEGVKQATENLYGDWDYISKEMRGFVTDLFEKEDYVDKYKEIRQQEIDNKQALIEFEETYPDVVVNQSNIKEVVDALVKKKSEEKNN
ncbi:MAG: hypothetical protein KBS56_04040 [Clostridiales bacterium]|nr:hypothetical protein [Candidatus Crickella equi]